MPKYRNELLLSLALLIITLLAYWPGLSGGFLLDDYPNIVTNPRVQPERLDLAAIRTAAKSYDAGGYGRPLATISFALDHAMHGKDPWGFKLSGLLVHAFNALLVFWLTTRLLSMAWGRSRRNLIGAFCVALLWSVHPMQVSSALYIVQRMETLSLTFVVLGLICYLHGRERQIAGLNGWPWIAATGVLMLAGLSSKETAALLPAYTLALELTILHFGAASKRMTRVLQLGYGTGATAAVLLFLFVVIPHFSSADAFINRDFNTYERVLTQFRILPMYMGQILLPLPSSLKFYYDTLVPSHSLISPLSTLFGAMLLLALSLGAWVMRKRAPLFSLGILWFLGAHLITSNVFNLELAFEHRNYFALLGVLLACADVIRRIPSRDGPTIKHVAIGAVLVASIGLTVIRSAAWGNPLHLALDFVARSPESPRASSDLGTEYLNLSEGDPKSRFFLLARDEFERGAKLPNASPLLEQGLIIMAATTGEPVEDRWWQQLIHKLATRPIGSQEISAVAGLMKQRYEGIELDDQRLSEAYSTMLRRREMPPQFYVQYANYALTHLGDQELADIMFVRAVDHADAQYAAALVAALVMDGRHREAEAVHARAQQLGLMQAPTSP
ncbi:hypothetical protein ACFOLC_11180 [Lysobacter cavernae]|uniref:Tetratricopeptide repeat protein n=1 Tax=Lysobacter cavernae TaxID=1685901 RepID=A0ABV7RPL1_9GAMM